MDRGAWKATVHGVTKNWTRLSDEHFRGDHWSARKLEWTPSSWFCAPSSVPFLLSPGEPSPRVREQGDVGKRWHQCHQSIRYRTSVQAPLPHQKHTLQPDYSGGLIHPPAATSDLNCSFHFPFHTILGRMLKGHSKPKGPDLMAPSTMVGTVPSPGSGRSNPLPACPAPPHH